MALVTCDIVLAVSLTTILYEVSNPPWQFLGLNILVVHFHALIYFNQIGNGWPCREIVVHLP